jgi:hypothetical protein
VEGHKVAVEVQEKDGVWPKDKAAALEFMDASNFGTSPAKEPGISFFCNKEFKKW